MSEPKLKPFPILGATPGFVMQSQGFGPWKFVLIAVSSMSTYGHDTEEEAIAEWNRRVRAVKKKFKNTGGEIKEFWDSMEAKP
jgi:phage-related protein